MTTGAGTRLTSFPSATGFTDTDLVFMTQSGATVKGTVAQLRSALASNRAKETFVAGTNFTAGTTPSLTLAGTYGSINNIDVYCDGVPQLDCTLSGTTLTFNPTIPLGTQQVVVRGAYTQSIGAPSDGTVNAPKFSVPVGTLRMGSASAPVAGPSMHAVDIEIHSSYHVADGANNPSSGIEILAFQHATNAPQSSNVRGICTTAIDYAGNINATTINNNFTEGARFQSIPGPGVWYTATEGTITYAATGTVPFMYAVGIESQVDNLYQDAPSSSSFIGLPFTASYMASCGEPSGTYKADAAYMTNPYNPSKYQSGFFVAGQNSVVYAAFANQSSAVWGIDLATEWAGTPPTYSSGCIRIPINSGIYARDASGVNRNILYYSTTRNVNIGQDSTGVALFNVTFPAIDNTYALGQPSTRWSVVYAGTGTINTSDATEKQDVSPITDEVLDAWADVNYVQYRWIDSVKEKGGEARTHIGLVAQSIRDAFAAKGLDATKYGFLCCDEIDGVTRWGIRPDQCLFLEAALMRRKHDKLEAKVAA